MPITSRSSAGLDPRRRRALFRAWHRGTREMDLLLGSFANARIEALDDIGLAEFERLMEVPDRDLFGWITGTEPTPANYDGPVLRDLTHFHCPRDI